MEASCRQPCEGAILEVTLPPQSGLRLTAAPADIGSKKDSKARTNLLNYPDLFMHRNCKIVFVVLGR